MNRLLTKLAIPVLALALVACATPAKEPSATTAPEKPEFRKKPRMNGRGEVSSISLEEFHALKESGKVLIYDARPGFFYNLGHIPGAVSLPKTNCDEKIAARESEIKAALADGKTIVVYCTSLTCPDARTVAIHISGFGHPASIFSGGWDAWKEAGMPTE